MELLKEYLERIVPVRETVRTIVVDSPDRDQAWQQFHESTAEHIAVVAHRGAGKSYALYEKALASGKDVTFFCRYTQQLSHHQNAFDRMLRERGTEYHRIRPTLTIIGGRHRQRTVTFATDPHSYRPDRYQNELVIFDDADQFVIDSGWLEQMMTYAQVIMVSSYSTVMDNAFKKFMDNKLKPAFGDGCVQPFIIPHPRITEYNDQDELNFGISEERFHMECSCNLAEARRHAYNRRRREMNATYQTGSLTAQ